MLTKTSLIILPLGPALASAGLLPSWLVSDRASTIENTCNVKGHPDYDHNYFWSASRKLASYAGCSARCSKDVRCESFGFDDRVCMLFNERLADNFEPDKRSDLVFYDALCVDAAAESTTSSAAPSTTHRASASRTRHSSATRTRHGHSGTRTPTSATHHRTTTGAAVGAGSTVNPVGGENSTFCLGTQTNTTGPDDGGAATTMDAGTDSGDSGLGAVPTAADGSSEPVATPFSGTNATSDAGSGLFNLTTASGDVVEGVTTVADSVPTGASSEGSGQADSGSESSAATIASADAAPTADVSSSTGTSSEVTSAPTPPFSNSTSTSTSSTSTPDGDCDIPQTFTVTSFLWFNSSNNLDCVQPNYANGSQVCWDSQDQLCDDPSTAVSDGCTCAPYCSADLPDAAYYQPAGFGPADVVSITVSGANMRNGTTTTCQQSNPPPPQSGDDWGADAEVGAGNLDCGNDSLSSADNDNVLTFYGDSSRNGTVGTIEFHPSAVSCNGRAVAYGATFPLLCGSDSDNNATCTTTVPLTLSLLESEPWFT